MPYACRQCGIILFGLLLLLVAAGSHVAIRLLTVSVLKHKIPGAYYPGQALGRHGEIAAGAKYPSLGKQAFGPYGEFAAGAPGDAGKIPVNTVCSGQGLAVILQQIGPCIMYIQVQPHLIPDSNPG